MFILKPMSKRASLLANFSSLSKDTKVSKPTPDQYNLDYLKENYPDQYKKWEATLSKTPKWLREEARGLSEGAGARAWMRIPS